MEKVIGIGEFGISNQVNDTIRTYALASCVAITVYSSKKKVAGMIHVALPMPGEKNLHKLGLAYFATTGIPLLFERLYNIYGCSKDELKIHMYGGADSIRQDDQFRIGMRNVEAARSTLAELNLMIHHAEVGGTCSRTLLMEVATGKVQVTTQPLSI
ncbi:chemotaxis protein CheD [Heliophilum fasciatum]|uniref:Probable chemoreceptor glutamine deamidase CheD n=1 Tax=Heliophilum fasciatum TaxID=35700 RepID=A0A4R2RMB4_9FIRM|nr:chemotaxis protein CheD [Heliophilum fasciatum]MCW2278327.1 chemotaxis protein CheD [Heliophilum fasciatum]TCP63799.1 CheD activator of MCP protein methylation [Heliophilum fasciatum]